MKKNTIIFTDFYNDEQSEIAKSCLLDQWHDEGDDISEPTEDQIYDEFCDLKRWEFDDLKYNLQSLFNKSKTKKWLIVGSLGLWNGSHGAGFIAGEFKKFDWNIFSGDYYNLEVKESGGRLTVEQHHHDGTNIFTVKELTEQGERYLQNHEYDTDAKTLHNKLLLPRYSRNLHYKKNIWGI